MLAEAGVTGDKLLRAMADVRGNQRVTSDNPEATYEALARERQAALAKDALPRERILELFAPK